MLGEFIRPGTISIRPEALALAAAFLQEGEKQSPSTKWIVGFVWYDDRRYREKGSNIWKRMSAGFDVCLFERDKVPLGAIWPGVTPLIVQVSEEKMRAFKQPEIVIAGKSPIQISLAERVN